VKLLYRDPQSKGAGGGIHEVLSNFNYFRGDASNQYFLHPDGWKYTYQFLSEKQCGKSHFNIILFSAVLGI
jgi:hypothetical protein